MLGGATFMRYAHLVADDDDIEAENERLRRRLVLAEAHLRMRQDPGALPAGESFFRIGRGEMLVAIVLLGAALAARLGL